MGFPTVQDHDPGTASAQPVPAKAGDPPEPSGWVLGLRCEVTWTKHMRKRREARMAASTRAVRLGQGREVIPK